MSMRWWILIAVVNTAAIVASVVARRSKRPKRSLRRVLYSCLVLFFVSPPLGVGLGLYGAFSAVGGEDVDPSQKARLLAGGISLAMNSLVFGVLGFLVPTVVALVLFLRAPKEDPQPDDLA